MISVRPLPALVSLSLVLTVLAGCGGLSGAVNAIETAKLPGSAEPALSAPAAIDREKTAQNALKRGLAENDPSALETAAKLRPRDPTYRYHQAVLYEALGDDEKAREAIVKGASLEADVGRGPAETLKTYYEGLLDAYLAVEQSFPRGSEEAKRAQVGYCGSLSRYNEILDIASPTDRLFSLYPDDFCP